MNHWTYVKYALALAGLALVLYADRLGHHWFGYVGLALILAAFFLRRIFRVPRRPI